MPTLPLGSGSFDIGEESADPEVPNPAGQKPRRKWLKMDRVPGQIDLYKALEKALKELKDLKAHAHPFLFKVCPFFFELKFFWFVSASVCLAGQGVGSSGLLQHHHKANVLFGDSAQTELEFVLFQG